MRRALHPRVGPIGALVFVPKGEAEQKQRDGVEWHFTHAKEIWKATEAHRFSICRNSRNWSPRAAGDRGMPKGYVQLRT
jgi:hypothetical protein